jgi:hypothetical protein
LTFVTVVASKGLIFHLFGVDFGNGCLTNKGLHFQSFLCADIIRVPYLLLRIINELDVP